MGSYLDNRGGVQDVWAMRAAPCFFTFGAPAPSRILPKLDVRPDRDSSWRLRGSSSQLRPARSQRDSTCKLNPLSRGGWPAPALCLPRMIGVCHRATGEQAKAKFFRKL